MLRSAEARLSNTGLSTYNGISVSRVASGIDTLVLSVRAPAPSDLLDALSTMRDTERLAAAAQEREPVAQRCGLQFAGDDLLLLPHGRKSWSVVLHNELCDVQLGRGGVSGVAALVRLSSAYLWSMPDIREIACDVDELVSVCFAGAGVEVMCSEVHLARDVAGLDIGEHWFAIERDLVRRADSVVTVAKHGHVETITLGARGGAVSAAIYDKRAELKSSHKDWFRDVWMANGWDGESPVWRVEFRCRRDLLRSVAINTLEDLHEKIAGLWLYLTHGWMRHTAVVENSSDTNRWRCPMSSWWLVYAASWLGSDCAALTREVKRVLDADSLIKQAAGCLLGAGALLGLVDVFGVVSLAVDRFEDLRCELGSDAPFLALIDAKRVRYAAAA